MEKSYQILLILLQKENSESLLVFCLYGANRAHMQLRNYVFHLE